MWQAAGTIVYIYCSMIKIKMQLIKHYSYYNDIIMAATSIIINRGLLHNML